MNRCYRGSTCHQIGIIRHVSDVGTPVDVNPSQRAASRRACRAPRLGGRGMRSCVSHCTAARQASCPDVRGYVGRPGRRVPSSYRSICRSIGRRAGPALSSGERSTDVGGPRRAAGRAGGRGAHKRAPRDAFNRSPEAVTSARTARALTAAARPGRPGSGAGQIRYPLARPEADASVSTTRRVQLAYVLSVSGCQTGSIHEALCRPLTTVPAHILPYR
jgi:hypothetical protein